MLSSFFAETHGSLGVWMYVYIGIAVFLAGIVRGASGFGFSMICVVLLLFVLPPAQVTPVILLWEIMASLGHLPFVYKQVDWRAIGWLSIGVLVGSPLGVYAVVSLPVKPLVVGINAIVLIMTLMLLRGRVKVKEPTKTKTAGTGFITGIINGISANGGPPVILFFLSTPAGTAVSRASLIAFFFFTDVWASLFYWREGLMTPQIVIFMVLFLVPLGVGMTLGSRLIRHLDEGRFRRIVLLLLLAITSVAFAQSLFGAFKAS